MPGPGRPSTLSRRRERPRRASWSSSAADGERRDRFDRDLERLRVVHARSSVERAGPTRPGDGGFVQANDELAGTRGRAPVHPPRVVARLVLAEREELAGGLGRGTRVPLGVRVGLAAEAAARCEDAVQPSAARRGPSAA